MNYELVLIPPGMLQAELSGTCVACGAVGKLELVEELTNASIANGETTDYEGYLFMCPECAMPHLELLNAIVDFEEPIVIGWN